MALALGEQRRIRINTKTNTFATSLTHQELKDSGVNVPNELLFIWLVVFATDLCQNGAKVRAIWRESGRRGIKI